LSHVETGYFAEALGKDLTRIFDFVRDEIGYEPYRGSLRGPRGTLLAMAGNSVDRAALVASLLEQSGFKVRYARGPLPEPLARTLIASVWVPRAGLPPPAMAAAPAPMDALAGRITGAIRRDSLLLRDHLKAAGITPPDDSTATAAGLVDDARDHYWVEILRDGAWAAMDPSFADAIPGRAYATAQQTFEQLPETLFHRVDVRLQIEEQAGETRSAREVLHYSARAADLSGVDVVLAHDPSEQPHQIQPFLVVHEQRVDGAPFWVKRPTRTTDTGLMDAFGGGGGDNTPVAVAESLELDFIAPDGHKESTVREIFDRLGKKRRAAGVALSPDQLLAAADATNVDDFVAAIYDVFLTTGAIEGAHLRGITTPAPVAPDDDVDVRAGLLQVNIAYTVISDTLSRRVKDPAGGLCRLYLDTPRVIIAELTGTADWRRLGLDLRRDRASALVTRSSPSLGFYAQVARGVIDGTLERFVVDHFWGSSNGQDERGNPIISTSWLFERAREQKSSPVTLVRGTAPPNGWADGDGRARIDEALAAGFAVVAPERAVEMAGVPRLAWWEVDPRTGGTVAVTDEGLHQAAEGIIIRYRGHFNVVLKVGRRVLPRTFRFGNLAEAQAFCEGMETRLLADQISFTWYMLPF
jgi:hypothetical protein